MRGELNQMKDFLRGLRQPAPSAPPAPAPGAAPDKTELTREFHRNPLDSSVSIARSVSEATSREAMATLGPALETLKAVARDKVREQDPELFDKYKDEIEARVNALQPQFHQNVNVWQNAFDITRGNHIREIIAAEREARPRSAAVHVSTEGGPETARRAAPSSDNRPNLTADEKLWADRLGLSEAQYAAGKEKFANQSERGKSSWDNYITFDSKEKRRKERERARNTNRQVA